MATLLDVSAFSLETFQNLAKFPSASKEREAILKPFKKPQASITSRETLKAAEMTIAAYSYLVYQGSLYPVHFSSFYSDFTDNIYSNPNQ